MEKEAVINILQNGLKDIDTLLCSFKKDRTIDEVFIDLLANKIDSLKCESELLRRWVTPTAEPEAEPTPTTAEEPRPSAVETPVAEPVVLEPEPEPEPKVQPEPEPEHQPEPEPEVQPRIEAKAEPEPEPARKAPEPQPKQVPTPKPAPAPKPAPEPKPAARHNADDIKNFGTPVSDVRKAIGINDRFLFMRELFSGNADEMNATLDAINVLGSYDEAYDMLRSQYGWDETRPEVEHFFRTIKRKFI